eukprot:COSAG01_NODE_190_length_22595_cov_16.442301_2_plen_187_part_00
MTARSAVQVWNATFHYQFNYKLSAFKFKIYDSDAGDVFGPSDDPLGQCELTIDQFYGKVAQGQPFTIDRWLPLRKGKGQLHVKLTVIFRLPVVTPGCRVMLPPHFQVAVGWDFKKKSTPFDLDASIVGLDAQEHVVDSGALLGARLKREGGLEGLAEAPSVSSSCGGRSVLQAAEGLRGWDRALRR